jgi:UDP-glucose 4-epimerase
MNVLVTGGAGFIGSHFVDRFLSEGYGVWALDNLRCGSRANLNPDAGFIQIDLNDPALGAELAKIRCEAVFHLAAHIDVRVSCRQPIFDATENIMATLRLLEAGLETGMRYFCFASSGGAIYGEADAGPQTEEQPEVPVSPYGAAKLAVDKYLYAYSVQRGLKSSSLRFSNVYGPRQGAKGEAGVVAVFSKLLREGKPPRVNGDGLQTRDFIYVADLAEAASMALRQRATGVFNLGTGLETSILDLARSLGLMAGADPSRVEYGPAIPGEQRRSVVDPSKAAKVLAWSPRTSLANGLRTTYEWFAAWKDGK